MDPRNFSFLSEQFALKVCSQIYYKYSPKILRKETRWNKLKYLFFVKSWRKFHTVIWILNLHFTDGVFLRTDC